MWLGVGAAAAGLSWIVTLVAMFASHPSSGLLVAAGLCVSVTVSGGTMAAWSRHSLIKATATHQSQLQRIAAGQHALVMAELRSMRKLTDQHAAHGTAERQALSAKICRLQEGYWHGAADMLQQVTGTEDNVRHVAFGRASVRPQDN